MAGRTRLPMTRRSFLYAGLTGIAGLQLPLFYRSNGFAFESGNTGRHLQIEKIERTTVHVPFREIPERAMSREIPHWRYSEIVEVHLKGGQVGFGETLLFYTWGATSDQNVAQVLGKNAASVMWDDSLGAGLQIALFDAVAKACEVPVHRLLGQKLYDKTPLSWWNIDTSADDMAAECLEAYRQGYLAYKTKGRPWFDIHEQLDKSTKAVPESFKIDMDFNDTLLDAERAIPLLKDLEKYPQVAIYESPIPQGDVKGNRQICEATKVAIAMHYGDPPAKVVIQNEACDGFVIGGGASRCMARGQVAAMADMPFWLQWVGTGITAAFSLHLGAVLSHATWPAVNCHQLYTHQMLARPIIVKDGFAAVPDEPGLGYDLDRDAIERFRVEKPPSRPEPERLIETRWPDGKTMYIANTGEVNFMLTHGQRGKIPFYLPGAQTRLVPNDGSSKWKNLYEKSCKEPYFVVPEKMD